ncbi:MAG: peptidase [Marmoricola sp.]|nr:peptidase [Marmoricola sp.]
MTQSELVEQRRQLVRDLCTRLSVDHLILGTADNIRYATDYRSLIIHETADHMLGIVDADGSAQILGPHVRQVELAPDPRLPHVQSVRPIAGWTPMHAAITATVDAVSAELGRASARSVGYDVLNSSVLDGLRARHPEIEFRCVSDDFFDLRRVKLPQELGLMERAAAANLAALQAGFDAARPGMTDREVLAVAVGAQQRGEAELITHFTCNVQSGYDWFAGGRSLEAGEPIFIDQVFYGQGGYTSDLTRTAFVGEPAAPVLDAYRRLVEVNQAVCEAARPGVRCSQLDELLDRLLAKADLAPSPYALGHGIGLRVMEPPSVFATGGDWTLRAGEVIALEPETSVEHGGRSLALKVEDCYLVEEGGLRPLTTPASAEPFVIPA